MRHKTLAIALLTATSLAACETTGFGPKAPDIILDPVSFEDTGFVEAVLLEEQATRPAVIEPQPTIIPRTFGTDQSRRHGRH